MEFEMILQAQEARQKLRLAQKQLEQIQYPADERSDDIKTRVMIAKNQIEGAINVIERSQESDRRINKRYTYHPNPFFNHETNRYRSDQEGNFKRSESFDG